MRFPIVLVALAALVVPAAASADGPFGEARRNIEQGRPENAILVITMGALGANATDQAGYTLLHYAAMAGSEQAIRSLLERGADPAVRGNDGRLAADLTENPVLRKLLAAVTE